MEKYCIKHILSNGKYLAVLNSGWRYDGSMVVEADNALELEYKLAQARYDDRWVTMKGQHVLIGGNGRIKAGVGGRLKGRMFGFKFGDYDHGQRLKGGKANGRRAIRVYKSFKGKTKFVKGQGKQQAKQQGKQITQHSEIKGALTSIGVKNISNSFMKLDKGLAVANVNQLLSLEHKFKIMGKSEVSVDAKNQGTAVAYVSAYAHETQKMTLSLCPKFNKNLNDASQAIKNAIQRGHSMPASEDKLGVYSITHEYGHMIQNKLFADYLKQKGMAVKTPTPTDYRRLLSYYQSFGMNCRAAICKIAGKNNPNFDIKKNLSKYGDTNAHEFFAEVFANSQLGAPNELGIAMQQWLKQQGF